MFLNLFHHARLAAMPPKLQSEDGAHIVIRPLAYCAEDDLAAYAEALAFPIIPCNLCGSQETLQRKAIKAMLGEWERKHPGRIDQIFRGIGNVRSSQLADRSLFDFVALGAREGAAPDAAAWLLGDGPAAEAASTGAPKAATPEPRTGLEILGA